MWPMLLRNVMQHRCSSYIKNNLLFKTLYLSSWPTCIVPFRLNQIKYFKASHMGHFVMVSIWCASFKGALDKFNIIPQHFPKKVGIFIPLEVLAWVMTACRVLRSRLTYFWKYMNISSIFYFSKSTSINTQCSSLWDTLKMMLFTKYLIKWKRIGRISWNFRYEFDLQSFIELDIKR